MFFEYRQNNSGGHFDVNDEVTLSVIIEAPNERVADALAVSHGIYFDDDYQIDCNCCGTRWGSPWNSQEVPSHYGAPLEEALKLENQGSFPYHWTTQGTADFYVYYLDGRKESYEFEGKKPSQAR